MHRERFRHVRTNRQTARRRGGQHFVPDRAGCIHREVRRDGAQGARKMTSQPRFRKAHRVLLPRGTSIHTICRAMSQPIKRLAAWLFSCLLHVSEAPLPVSARHHPSVIHISRHSTIKQRKSKIYSMIIGLNKDNVVPVTDSVVSRC